MLVANQSNTWLIFAAPTLQTLEYAPEDAQAVLLLLHAPPAPAVVQGALLHGVDGAATLALRLGAGHRAEVALPARHALPHGAVLGAARVLLQTLLAGLHAVEAGGPGRGAAVAPQGEQRVWESREEARTRFSHKVSVAARLLEVNFTAEGLMLAQMRTNLVAF